MGRPTPSGMAAAEELRRIRLRYAGTCAGCEQQLGKGAYAWHDRATKEVRCEPCAGRSIRDTAGAGARRRYEQLHGAREERARERYGALGVAAVRWKGDPQHIDAWRRGAEGEERAAAELAKLLDGTGVHLLHDRRMPGSRANIDHLAIGPGGVTIIDAKNVGGRVTVERSGGLFSPRVDHLVVGGRRRPKLIEGLERQELAVRAVLADLRRPETPIALALCWMRTDGLPFLRHPTVGAVVIDGPKAIARLAARPGGLDATAVERLTLELAGQLPAA